MIYPLKRLFPPEHGPGVFAEAMEMEKEFMSVSLPKAQTWVKRRAAVTEEIEDHLAFERARYARVRVHQQFICSIQMNLTTQLNQSYQYNGINIRVAGTSETPLFCAKDVCSVLGIQNSRDVTARLEATIHDVDTVDAMSRKQKMSFVGEDGLYELIFASRKPEAKLFRQWVFSEVLPSIRKTGRYDHVMDQGQLRLQQLNVVEKEIQVMNSGVDFLERIGAFDDRARAMMQSSALNLYSSNGAQPNNADGDDAWSISRRAQHLFSRALSTKKDKALLCDVGKRMSQIYKECRGVAPPKRTQFVDGTTRDVNHYTLRDFKEFGDNVLLEALGRGPTIQLNDLPS